MTPSRGSFRIEGYSESSCVAFSASSALVLSAHFLELIFQLGNSCLRGAHPDVAVRVKLPEPFEFRSRGNELSLQSCRRVDHGLTLLLDINRRVLARKLAKLLLGSLQILADGLQTSFQENPLAAR